MPDGDREGRFGHGSPSRSLARSEQQTHLVLSASSSQLNKGRTGSPETVHYQHHIANRVFARISPPAATGCEPIQPSSPYRDPGRAPGLLANVRKAYEALDSQNSAKIDASAGARLVTIPGYS